MKILYVILFSLVGLLFTVNILVVDIFATFTKPAGTFSATLTFSGLKNPGSGLGEIAFDWKVKFSGPIEYIANPDVPFPRLDVALKGPWQVDCDIDEDYTIPITDPTTDLRDQGVIKHVHFHSSSPVVNATAVERTPRPYVGVSDVEYPASNFISTFVSSIDIDDLNTSANITSLIGALVYFPSEDDPSQSGLCKINNMVFSPLIGSRTLSDPSSIETLEWTINPIPFFNQRESQIDVSADKTNLNPHPVNHIPAKDKDLKSTITVTVTDSNNQPVSDEQVELKACTVQSTTSNDGHQNHDTGRTNECDAGTAQTDKPKRPTAMLNEVKDTNMNPLILTTDANGKITITYIPPKGFNSNTWISGRDHIIASLVSDPSIKDENTFIETRVPNLQQMEGSVNCAGLFDGPNQIIQFLPQANHDCLFFGTSSTNQNLKTIARTYHDRQVACAASAPLFNSPACNVSATTGVKITNIEPLRVTAMSSNWGGLLDIGPPNICKRDPNRICDLWTPPHSTHGDGKNVDIGFGRTTFIILDDNLRLLKDVILDTIGGISFPNPLPYPNEGGSDSIPANHFHVRFPN